MLHALFFLNAELMNVSLPDLVRTKEVGKAKLAEKEDGDVVVREKSDVVREGDGGDELLRQRKGQGEGQEICQKPEMISAPRLNLREILTRPFALIGQHQIWDIFAAKFLGGCSVLVFRHDVNQR